MNVTLEVLRTRRPRWVPIALAVGASLLPGACATRTLESGAMSGMGPVLSVERFLQAANARDYEAMARLFGTEDGPIADTGSSFGCAFKKMGSWLGLSERCPTRQEVELRMNAISMVLRHTDYAITSEESVPGRVGPTTRVSVDLTQGENVAQEVPFVVVRTGDALWLIEQIGLERITGRDR